MGEFFRSALLLLSWTGLLTAVEMQGLLARGFLVPLDLLMILGASFGGGLALGDAKKCLLAAFPAYVLSLFLTYLLIVSPGLSASRPAGFSDVLYEGGLVLVVTTLFPVPILFVLGGSLAGGFLGERVGFG